MGSLLKRAVPLAPEAKVQLLYDSEVLEAARMQAARKGNAEAPSLEEELEYHYICFVKEGGRL